jgi:flagellar biosynthesis/type III secretory pathway protein FliH
LLADSVIRTARFPTFQFGEEWEPKQPRRLTAAEEADKARDAARLEGLTQGRDEGRAAALAEWAPRLAGLAAALEQATAVARTERERLAAELTETVPLVTVALARKVIEHELTRGEDAVRTAVGPIARRLAQGGAASVRLAPDVAEALAAWRGERGEEAALAGVTIHADASLGRGDWIIETESGFLDGRLTSQLDEATRLLSTEGEA